MKTIPQEILNVCELSVKYTAKTKAQDRHKISRSQDAENILRPFYENTGMMEQREIFTVLLITRDYKVMGILRAGEGGPASTIVDLQYILRAAILTNSQALILCHNHPSGNTTPSEPDKQMVKKIRDAAKRMDISVLDSVIITDSGFYSMADNGDM